MIELRKLSASEQLCYITVRIECHKANGLGSTGTGFFYMHKTTGEDSGIPVVITNKHVVKDAISTTLVFTRQGDDGNPNDTNHLRLTTNESFGNWFGHPEDEVDLCAMPIGGFIKSAAESNAIPFFRTFALNNIATAEEQKELNPLEDVVMIGYPNGIWDKVHNMPILRKGVTATSPNLDYNGKEEFMIDIAALPGSSGSPVIILNENGYTTRSGDYMVGGTRMHLLGVLSSGPTRLGKGEIVLLDDAKRPVPVMRLMTNLGVVIKANRIVELLDFMMGYLEQESS